MVFGFTYLAVLIVLALIVLFLIEVCGDFIYKMRNPPEKIQAEMEKYNNRLLNPDWDFYSSHLLRKVPEDLIIFFENQELLEKGFLIENEDVYIDGWFCPIDEEGSKEASWIEKNVVPFASCNGDPIYLKPGLKLDNSVYITYHDGGDIELLYKDIKQFIEEVRNNK